MIKECIGKVVMGEDLMETEMEKAMDEIMSGEATPAQIAALITALRIKGETVDEITGAARTMRAKATRILKNAQDQTILDIVGTGGDGAKTFNVSTTTAFVVAGGGVKIAKHGNRAVSSQCGAADVLENLGVRLDITPEDVERCVQEVGIGFLFAPVFHSAMKYAAGPRKEVGIRSIFNMLGPLTNPAGATNLLLGVYDMNLTETFAHVLNKLGTREAFVVCGEETCDEISISGPTHVSHLKNNEVKTFQITPEEYGLKRATMADITGGDAKENADIMRKILDGEKSPKMDIVLINAAAAFVASGVSDDLNEGLQKAQVSINSGAAQEKLENMVAFTQKCT